MPRVVTVKKVFVVGDRKEVHADVLLDNNYPAAGYPLTAADLGLEGGLDLVDPGLAVKADNTLATLCSYDETNKTLRCWKSNTASNPQPVAAAADLSTYTVRVRAVGRGSAGTAA